MKHLIFRITSLIIAGLLTVFIVSCDKTYETDIYEGTTSIRLRIPNLDNYSRASDDWDEDRINTLRVIILSENAGSINKKFLSDQISGGSIVIENVPVGLVQMYVIANETSLGKNYDDLSLLQQDVEQSTKKVLIEDLDRTFFPKIRPQVSTEVGLPMSWMDKECSIKTSDSGEIQTIEVFLERAVAKLNIVMENTLSDVTMDISEIRLGSFFANSLYLFKTEKLDVPDNTEYTDKIYNENLNIEIPPHGSKELVCYVYPSFAWKDGEGISPYTIGFISNGSNYKDLHFISDGQPMNSIPRNTQVNIYATLVSPSILDVNFTVDDWVPETIIVPPFN